MARSRVSRVFLWTLVALVFATFLFGLYSIMDEHRSVTEQMGWECILVEDTKSPKFPHVEEVELWFVRNPHFEERASGPRLCAELKEAGQTYVAVSFDVWGNRLRGLHGYNGTGVALGPKQLEVYSFGLNSYHTDTAHPSGLAYPDIHRFPLEVFR
jgi:hypothetical protein